MRRVALFARSPDAGPVKTRLSPAMPGSAAAVLHAGMLSDALSSLGAASADHRTIYWASSAPELPALGGAIERRRQVSGNLGVRLVTAFSELLRSQEDRAAIFGADCPALTAASLTAALDAIESSDLALAPSRDGGFTIIAMRRPVPELFADIPWSSSQVFATTRARAHSLGLEVKALPPLDEVDTPDDVCRLLAWVLTEPESRAPSTRTALRELRLLPDRL